jgi:hypothetical protein
VCFLGNDTVILPSPIFVRNFSGSNYSGICLRNKVAVIHNQNHIVAHKGHRPHQVRRIRQPLRPSLPNKAKVSSSDMSMFICSRATKHLHFGAINLWQTVCVKGSIPTPQNTPYSLSCESSMEHDPNLSRVGIGCLYLRSDGLTKV